MQEQDTINILVSQLLSKDDELLRLRKDNERLLSEQREGNRQILEKLDRTLDELKSMRRDNKHLADQLSNALEAKAQAEQQSEFLSDALEELKNLRAAELFEIGKQKRQLYGRKSEKSSSLLKDTDTDKDLKNDKDDLTGVLPRRRLSVNPAYLQHLTWILRPPLQFIQNPNLCVRIMASALHVWTMW